ncbi:hypothetical protein [Natronorubrum sulfidifaciens]|uniref:Uncharacterized protein n=1 Tax=Natronorubrum sulfidifaciens JCM 14089 TaxID=1230460 RepID=L9W880_9EURY|nr:hypothetical protein [Natronorubrum sulfidifaciens]ELY45694.1 hypothetical protein C495_07935 [Natronorubrum sulfidifaciens JCM 14089]
MGDTIRDRSTAVALARRGLSRVRSAAAGSRLHSAVSGNERIRSRSTDDGHSDSRVGALLSTSVVGASALALENRLTAATDTARVTNLTTAIKSAVTGSFCYRWLTAEPEPEVIEIDLRETWTAGPVITTIDRTCRELAAGVPTATITGIGTDVATFVQARPIRAASLALLPALFGSLLLGTFTGTLSTVPVAALVALAALAAAGLRSTTTLEELQATRAAQLLSAAFEPPEPPTTEQNDIADRSEDDTDDDQQ